MKYIKKDRKNEPETLRDFVNGRKKGISVSYKGFGGKDQLLKTALLKEQGYICAYCLRAISLDRNKELNKPKIEVEHYKSQENFQNEDLNYMNMLGVCNGKIIGKDDEIIEHCDKSRKYIKGKKTHSLEFKILNPIIKGKNENLVTYDLNGKIVSKSNNKEVEDDINMLNLNNKKLIDFRLDAWLKARKKFEKENPQKSDKRWNIEMFDREIEKYKSKNSEGKYKAYCQFIIWNFELLKSNTKYSEKE